ncbi:phosphatidylserine decarboxylase [Desulfobulbus alkaliphilus]|uniref:phosphatidylserine decarboxylase n=1 Tax=Desulfobulbus alkaliphilus TaxID=869814 RepID=UPI0019623C55|nr:phosphatidylserine decarboxylase [Desulfobulbus alkaliphilus]MBM9536096.1 phosphatidylserine decarboxylase [Desulfobulbus alkaliphilus]
MQHQYIVRTTGEIINEQLIADRFIRLLYHQVREHAPSLFRILTAKRMSGVLGSVMFDCSLPLKSRRGLPLLEKMGVNWQECVDPPHLFTSPRHVFERKIRYWDCRPMDSDPRAVVSPADARLLFGSLADSPELFIKNTFFSLPELLGEKTSWMTAFSGGDFALFRLTPDKYHYNHVPVTGDVVDIYSIDGCYHSCNPEAVIALASLHAKNRRIVTIIDTDVAGGTRIGLVAMIEVVALMIGDIVQQYSAIAYENPLPVVRKMRLQRGCPKSLYRPGSSTDILLFQKNAVTFAEDLQRNLVRGDVQSRFSAGLGRPLVETDLEVRSTIAVPADRMTTAGTLLFSVS